MAAIALKLWVGGQIPRPTFFMETASQVDMWVAGTGSLTHLKPGLKPNDFYYFCFGRFLKGK